MTAQPATARTATATANAKANARPMSAVAPRIGARALCEALVAQGVNVIFGYPGGAVLPIYDVLREFPLRHVLVRHEQGAAHAADGYSRASGAVGVALATSGPGAINLVTGLATAMMDSVPMLAITATSVGQCSAKTPSRRRTSSASRCR